MVDFLQVTAKMGLGINITISVQNGQTLSPTSLSSVLQCLISGKSWQKKKHRLWSIRPNGILLRGILVSCCDSALWKQPDIQCKKVVFSLIKQCLHCRQAYIHKITFDK